MKTIRFSLILSLLTFLLLFHSCDKDNDNCISNLGDVLSETRALDDFHSISFDGVGNIFLTQGSPQSIRFEGNEKVLDQLQTDVSNNLLEINFDRCLESTNYELNIFITIPDIRFLSLNGVGNITAENDWNIDDLMIDMNGVGNISLRGTANTLDIKSNGVGNVKAFGLITNTCEVRVSGTGNVEVYAKDALDVTINGTANVLYKGNPTISVNINGAGNLIDSN